MDSICEICGEAIKGDSQFIENKWYHNKCIVNLAGRKYIVFIQDEWNNLYWIGEFKELSDAVPEVNTWLESYNTSIDTLEEYVSTYGPAIDREIEVDDDTFLMVRGFVL